MSVPSPDGVLEIDLSALAENWRRLKDLGGAAECAAVVKADAYGLGLDPVARKLWAVGCNTFFVAQLIEALALRAILPEARIGVLNGLVPGAAGLYAEQNLIPVLNCLPEVAAWQAESLHRNTALPAFLHVDTGMTRLGLDGEEQARVSADPSLLSGIAWEAVMSHLITAEQPQAAQNGAQRDALAAFSRLLPQVPVSLCNSSGIFLGRDYHFDLLRPGVALYGVNPTPGRPNPMRPVVTAHLRILQTRKAKAGETVGYGGTYRLTRDSHIATLAGGYADGLPWQLSNRGQVWAAGHLVPILGRVSMDLMGIDITDLPPDALKPGDLVEVVGPNRPIETVAAEGQSFPYELLTRIGKRYHRLYTTSDSTA